MSTKRIQALGKDDKPVWLQPPEDTKEVILEFRCNLSHMSFDELFHLQRFIEAAKLRLTPQEMLKDTQGLCNALQTRNLWMEKDIETIKNKLLDVDMILNDLKCLTEFITHHFHNEIGEAIVK